MRPVQQLFPSASFRTYGLHRYKHYNKTDDEKWRFALAGLVDDRGEITGQMIPSGTNIETKDNKFG